MLAAEKVTPRGCNRRGRGRTTKGLDMAKFINHAGRRYGRLLVLERGPSIRTPAGNPAVQWFCRCDCGATVLIRSGQFNSGKTTSCGCRKAEAVAARNRTAMRDIVTYTAAHYRVYEARGRAKNYACVDCGANALDWSYDGSDPDELHEDRPVSGGTTRATYSLDVTRYVPRCRSCHCKFDRSVRT